MAGSSASEVMEYDRAERWLTDGVRYAGNAERWNHRHYMASHLAHVQWATGQWDAAAQTAQGALADGRGGITTWITAQYVLGYLAMGRGDWSAADNLLREALATGERMAELQRLSPPLWGLAETARCRGDYDTALILCERGYQASAEVMDAACLFPYLLTGVRVHLARGDVEAAEEWSARVGAVLTARYPRDAPRDRPGGAHPARPGRYVRGAPGAGISEGVMAGPGDVLGSRGTPDSAGAGGARRDQATGPMMAQACAAVLLQV
jgi:Tetratricopeptide repeat